MHRDGWRIALVHFAPAFASWASAVIFAASFFAASTMAFASSPARASKDELFLAVLERAYAAIRDSEQGLELESLEPVEAVRRLVRFTWGFQVAHPEFITLLNSENLHQGRHLAQSKLVAGLHSRLLELIGRLLERGAKAGAFRRGVDSMQLYISIAGLGYFYLSNRHTLSAIFGRDLMAPRFREARMAHMIDVVLGYLKP
jgi:AcrR family transcriptional regulator